MHEQRELEGTAESKESNCTELRGAAMDKALCSQEALVCQVFTILVDLIFFLLP